MSSLLLQSVRYTMIRTRGLSVLELSRGVGSTSIVEPTEYPFLNTPFCHYLSSPLPGQISSNTGLNKAPRQRMTDGRLLYNNIMRQLPTSSTAAKQSHHIQPHAPPWQTIIPSSSYYHFYKLYPVYTMYHRTLPHQMREYQPTKPSPTL